MVTHKDIPVLGSKQDEYKFLSKNRWPDGRVICPGCGSADVKERGGKQTGFYIYRCTSCEKAKRPKVIFSPVAGTALNAYQIKLESLLFISLEMNKGADGLSLEYMAKTLKSSIKSVQYACIKLGKLYEEGNAHILGQFAPKYAHRSSVKKRNELKLKAPVSSRAVRKNYVEDHVIDPNNPIFVQRADKVVVNKIRELDHIYVNEENSTAQLKSRFSNRAKEIIDNMSEQQCVQMIKNVLYPNGVIKCPHCDSDKSTKSWRDYYRCGNCKKKYNWKTGTYFMSSRIPVKKCLSMIMKFYHARKSVSSHEIGRELSISQRTAYRHMMKLRKCMFIKNMAADDKFKGPVQYDEKTIKKSKLVGEAPDGPGGQRIYKTEKAVVSVIADMRTGEIRHISLGAADENKGALLLEWLRENIDEGSVLLMDATTQINSLKKEFNLMKVNHSAKQFARKANFPVYYEDNGEKCDLMVTNNAIEGFWSRFADQKDVTYQHRFDIKNLPYYLSDTANRLTPGCMVKYGLGVGLSSMLELCHYSKEERNGLHKKYNPKDYFDSMRVQKRKRL